MQFSYAAIAIAALAGFSSANLTPSCVAGVGANPQGNPIHAPITGTIVPAGSPFTITWTNTTTGTVTLLLLKGPSTNVVPIDTIATSIPNSGSFIWTPSTALAPTADAQGYGIEIVDDTTCTYQYSTQFGISNSASTGTTTVTSTVTGTAAPLTTITSAAPVTVTTLTVPTSNATVSSLSTVVTPTTTLVVSTVAPVNGTTVYPTGTATAPGTVSGTAGGVPTATVTPFTGSAGRKAVGTGSVMGVVAALAVFAL